MFVRDHSHEYQLGKVISSLLGCEHTSHECGPLPHTAGKDRMSFQRNATSSSVYAMSCSALRSQVWQYGRMISRFGCAESAQRALSGLPCLRLHCAMNDCLKYHTRIRQVPPQRQHSRSGPCCFSRPHHEMVSNPPCRRISRPRSWKEHGRLVLLYSPVARAHLCRVKSLLVLLFGVLPRSWSISGEESSGRLCSEVRML